VPLEETPEFKAALEAAIAAKVAEAVAAATAKLPKHEPAYRAYATKEISPACVQYAKWLNREFADLYPDGVDARLLMIATRAYRWFQQSDLSLKAAKDSPETA
jgi:hypothetical protein